MAFSTQHHHNQLLFNMNVPAMPANLAVKFHKPEALVVEKFGPTLTPMSTPITSQPSMPVSSRKISRQITFHISIFEIYQTSSNVITVLVVFRIIF